MEKYREHRGLITSHFTLCVLRESSVHSMAKLNFNTPSLGGEVTSFYNIIP